MPKPVRIISFGAFVLGAVGALASCAADSASSSTLAPMVVPTTAFATMPPVTLPPTTLPGQTTTVAPGAPIDYVVKSGDTMYGIARDHGVSADDIVTLNGWSSVQHPLSPGQTIKVPAPTASSAATTEPGGDTTTPSGTVPSTSGETTQPPTGGATTVPTTGGATTVPTTGGDTSTPAAGEEYTVKNNDTVYGIANRHDITPQELVDANGWGDVSHALHPGDTIIVPAAS